MISDARIQEMQEGMDYEDESTDMMSLVIDTLDKLKLRSHTFNHDTSNHFEHMLGCLEGFLREHTNE